MIVFHTSNIPVPQPDVLHSRKYLDFGQGFYVTPTKMQAVRSTLVALTFASDYR